MAQESWFERIWRLMTPELVYFGICYLVDIVVGMYWGYSIMGDYIADDLTVDVEGFTATMMEMLMEYAMLLQSIAALVAIFFLARMYLNDYKKRRFVFDKRSVKTPYWILLIPAGVFASLAGNMLMNVSDLAEMSESFQESEQLLFSGPFIIQIVGIGLIIPVCEELIYRGLIYMRMRQYLNVNLAIVASALIFGIVHGNIVQGIYAFMIGILFAYAYEKYGSLKAPVILHISANILSLALTVVAPSFDSRSVLMGAGIVSVLLCLAVVFVIDRNVSAERIYFTS
ncbi:MAG: lysostaphin resistance A-like protein [Coprococcus sp.]